MVYTSTFDGGWSDASSTANAWWLVLNKRRMVLSPKSSVCFHAWWLSVYFPLALALKFSLSFPLFISLEILFDIARPTAVTAYTFRFLLCFHLVSSGMPQILLLLAWWRRNLLRAEQVEGKGWQADWTQCGRCHCQIAVSSTTYKE
jgi:hypothetical protein